MKNFISSMAAMNAVMNELGLDGQELYGLSIVRADGLYELRFRTDFTAYDCYAEFVGRVPREFSRRFVAVGSRVGDLRVDLQCDAAALLCDVGCSVDVVRTAGERHCRCGNEETH